MRVLHLIQRYYPATGGAEKHMAEISAHLAAQGHKVTVATSDALDFELFWDPARRRIPAAKETYQGTEILRFPVRHLPASKLAFPALRRLLLILSRTSIVPVSILSSIARYTPWIPGLWSWVQDGEHKYDLVAAMTIGFETILDAGRVLSERLQAPFVTLPMVHMGAGPSPGSDTLSRFYAMRHQTAIALASDMILAQTPAEQSFYLSKGGDPKAIRVVGSGINPDEVLGGVGERFRREMSIENPFVLYIGYLAQDKGAFDTVKAVRLLRKQITGVDLVLIGAVSPEFQSYYDRLPEEERRFIHVLGPVGDSTKKDALAAATAFSMPSRSDSFGITYLEAWLYGLPVVAARTWGVTDVVNDGDNGLVVPFGDPGTLAIALKSLLSDPERAAEMGERGRKQVYAKHLWKSKVKEIEEIYLSLVRGRTE